jgi:hypothetical protein
MPVHLFSLTTFTALVKNYFHPVQNGTGLPGFRAFPVNPRCRGIEIWPDTRQAKCIFRAPVHMEIHYRVEVLSEAA